MSYEVTATAVRPYDGSQFLSSEHDSFLTDWRAMRGYSEVICVAVRRSQTLVAEWLVPAMPDRGNRALQRPFRLLPYTRVRFRPLLHESERRHCTAAIAEHIVSPDSGISLLDLPLSPYADTIAPFADAGITIEYRQTYLIDLASEWERAFSETCRNNIRRAHSAVNVVFESNHNAFDCVRGITNEGTDAWAARSSLARELLTIGRGVVATAYGSNRSKAGQCFLAWDTTTAYLLHSWRAPNATRGTMNLVISKLIRYAISELNLKRFDLEGSVVPGVDLFYSTFGGRPTGYPWLSWRR